MKKTIKKIANIIIDIIVILILLISVLIVVLSLTSKSSGVPNIFGVAPLNVLSPSMEDTFSEGDLIFAKVTNDSSIEYEVGDIVSFKQVIDGEDKINTHRIVDIIEKNGQVLYQTKGDNNEYPDEKYQTSGTIIAKYTGNKIPWIGTFFGFIRTPTGFFFCILLPMILFFVYEIIRVILNIMAYNKAKATEMAAEQVANSELTEEQKQRAIAEYLAQQKEQAENAPPQDSESEVQTPAADEATAPDDTAATAESPETAPDADPDETI